MNVTKFIYVQKMLYTYCKHREESCSKVLVGGLFPFQLVTETTVKYRRNYGIHPWNGSGVDLLANFQLGS